MSEKTFNFKIIDSLSGTNKKGATYYKIITYCNFDFIVNFYLTPEKYNQLKSLMQSKDFNINDYINVFFDKNTQNFAYFIKL